MVDAANSQQVQLSEKVRYLGYLQRTLSIPKGLWKITFQDLYFPDLFQSIHRIPQVR